jgi:hypothetical protein
MDAEPVARTEPAPGQHARQPVARGVNFAEGAVLMPALTGEELERRLVAPGDKRKIK